MLTISDNIIICEHFGRCVQIARIEYRDRLRVALTRYSPDVARIVADRPLESDEAQRLAVRLGLVMEMR